MKGYSTLPRAPKLEPNHQMQFTVITSQNSRKIFPKLCFFLSSLTLYLLFTWGIKCFLLSCKPFWNSSIWSTFPKSMYAILKLLQSAFLTLCLPSIPFCNCLHFVKMENVTLEFLPFGVYPICAYQLSPSSLFTLFKNYTFNLWTYTILFVYSLFL